MKYAFEYSLNLYFRKVKILNPFNLKRHYKDKGIIVDVKCITKVKEKTIMEEAHKQYNNFIRSRLMMSEYEKKEIYQYNKK